MSVLGVGMKRSPTLTGLIAVTSACLSISCSNPSPQVIDAAVSGDPERLARALLEAELSRNNIPVDLEDLKNLEDIPTLIRVVRQLLTRVWGEDEPEVASDHRYVKYSNDYEARAIVDFDEGWLQVETIASERPLEKLRQATINTLLTSRDMTVEDIFTDVEAPTGGEPFLYKQVLDADGEPIRWEWRAARFADHLLDTALTSSRENGRVYHRVRVALVNDHLKLRSLDYADAVLAAARRYAVAPSLIYAVIEVESGFNPYAVSPANAYGLMQVVPSSAGRDVYDKVKKLPGQPTREQLFKPAYNIDVGSAYLHLLDDTYLKRISDSSSRRFATIAAYNGGAGSTLKAFDTNRDRAIARINRLSSSQVYTQIVSSHPFGETRRYLEKVRAAETKYR